MIFFPHASAFSPFCILPFSAHRPKSERIGRNANCNSEWLGQNSQRMQICNHSFDHELPGERTIHHDGLQIVLAITINK